jgi:hypothetical protein
MGFVMERTMKKGSYASRGKKVREWLAFSLAATATGFSGFIHKSEENARREDTKSFEVRGWDKRTFG